MLIKYKGQTLFLEFGLKGISLIREMINKSEDVIGSAIYFGLLKYYPTITISEAIEISQSLDADTIQSILEYISSFPQISQQEIDEDYEWLVGTMNISPQHFFCLSNEEMDILVDGYYQGKELDTNLLRIAIEEGKKDQPDVIRLVEDKGYIIGNQQEREQMFKNLGIEV